jgi:hypothetical protein
MPLSLKEDAVPVAFVRQAPPQDQKALVLYLMSEVEKLQTSIATLVNLVPQVAIAPPVPALNGMIRYAKAPWDPLGTGDAFVKYDGSWTAL